MSVVEFTHKLHREQIEIVAVIVDQDPLQIVSVRGIRTQAGRCVGNVEVDVKQFEDLRREVSAIIDAEFFGRARLPERGARQAAQQQC